MKTLTYKKDIKGKKFYKLTVKEFSHLNNTRHAMWKCICDCGTETIAESRLLLNGTKKSCGCLTHQVGNKSLTWKGCGDLSKSHFSKIMREAIKRSLEFEVDMEFLWELYLKQNKKCALSGEDIVFRSQVHLSDGTASLDRIDSNKGYTIDNVQWVHKIVNMMKQNLPENIFEEWCKKIYIHKTRG